MWHNVWTDALHWTQNAHTPLIFSDSTGAAELFFVRRRVELFDLLAEGHKEIGRLWFLLSHYCCSCWCFVVDVFGSVSVSSHRPGYCVLRATTTTHMPTTFCHHKRCRRRHRTKQVQIKLHVTEFRCVTYCKSIHNVTICFMFDIFFSILPTALIVFSRTCLYLNFFSYKTGKTDWQISYQHDFSTKIAVIIAYVTNWQEMLR